MSRLQFLYLPVGSLVFAVCVAAGLYGALIGGVDPGLTIAIERDNAIVRDVFPFGPAWSAGFREGQTVVGGAALPSVLASETVSRSFTVVDPDGASQQITVVPAGNILGETLALLIVALLFFGSGVLVLRRAPAAVVPRLYYFLGCTGACTLALAASPRLGPIAIATEIVWFSLVGLAFLLFFAAFPVDRTRSTAVRVVLVIQSLLSGALLVSFVVAVFGPDAAHSIADALLSAVLGFSFTAGVALAVIALLRPPNAASREQLRIIGVGTATAVLPVLLLSIAPDFLGLEARVPSETSVLFMAILPLSFTYAIMRYQAMGIRRLVHRGVVYFTLGVLVISSYGVFVGSRHLVLPDLSSQIDFIVATDFVFLLAAILLFPNLLRVARGFVDRILYRDAYDYRVTLEGLSAQAATYDDIGLLVSTVLSRLRTVLALRHAVIVLAAEPAPEITVEQDDDLDAALAHSIQGDAIDDLTKDVAYHIRELPDEQGQVLFIQLATHTTVIGSMALGPKTTGEPFRPVDVSLITTFGRQLAAVIENARLVEELKARLNELERSATRLTQSREQLRSLNVRLVRATEDERRRIAVDLHDGPLQDVVALARTLELVKGAEDCYVIARQVATDIREFSSRLRPAILDDLGLEPSLEWLSSRVGERSGLRVTLDLSALGDQSRMSPEIETTLFRVTQEGLSNCVNHAEASHAEITVERENGTLILKIKDNGRGFDADAYFASPKPGHMGLVGMSERLYQVGGVLEIVSAPGAGTEVRAQVPIEGIPK